MNTEISFGFKLILKGSDNEPFFGPGVATLLRAIDQTGNVKEAVASMGLSYTKAWTMLRNTKKGIGTDAVLSSKGGVNGGKAELTEAGRELLMRYEEFESRSGMLLNDAFKGCFNEDQA